VKKLLGHAAGAILEGALVALLITGLLVGSAFAKGGGSTPTRGGHHGGGSMTATVSVSPNPVPAFSEFVLRGCGYTPGAGVQFNLYEQGGVAVWGGLADASGCLTNASGWSAGAGSARLDVLQGSTTLVASTTFTIK
jgi:hypothetical protein